jgi:ribonucleoside-diphosphate reductase alpha chain
MLAQEFPKQALRMVVSGRRNVNWSTIAPTGTLSILAKAILYPNISSGCEPQFDLWYFRNKKVDANEPYDWIDEVGIRWKQYPVLMGAFKAWIVTTYGDVDFNELSKDTLEEYYKNSPWYKSTANDIDWKKRIDMQAVLQKYTTSAISSTINLPSDVKESVISDLYMYAWEKELKGITCYRDGSKGGVLVKESKKEGFDYKDAVKRPKVLIGDGYTVKVKGDEYMVLVGLMDNKPYEVFASKNIWDVPTKFACEIVRKGKTKYTIHAKDLFSIEDFNIQVTDEEAAITRLISTSLRHGVAPKFLASQLNKTQGSIVNFDKAIARILNRYTQDEVVGGCPECGGEIVRIEGCEKCPACGFSKC